MSERQKAYPFDEIEARWQRRWEENQTFHAPGPGEPGFDPAKPKRLMPRMRRLFARAGLEKEEVAILRGMLTTFETPKRRG